MKGFYSVLIGVIVLFVLATAIFSVSSFNKSQSLIPQKESFGFTLREWQNTRMLLDKATSDAIIDSAVPAGDGTPNGCLENTTTATFVPDSNITTYDQNVIDLTNRNCIIRNILITKELVSTTNDPGANEWEENIFDINVGMNLECMYEVLIGIDLNSLASYNKNILFEKTVDANYNMLNGDCNLFVLDKQSNLMDVNYFIN